jgi:phosphoesterase RecJ-like protein
MAINTTSLDFSAFLALVQSAQEFILTTHVNPDGDALGAEIGLADWLLSLGKRVRMINHSPLPYNYTFLNTLSVPVEQFDFEKHDGLLTNAEQIIVLDVNDADRVRSLAPYVSTNRSRVTIIDHHLEPKDFAQHYFIDTEACSTGEIIYKLIESARPKLGGKLSQSGAVALYVAIMTDTGNFKFPRTDSEVFRICADLLDLGADPVATYDQVYNAAPASRLLLLRECLNSLGYHYDDRMALQTLTQAQLEQTKSNEEDVDGFVQMPFQVGGIVLSVFLLQLKQGWKLSARSKGEISAAALAQAFGGNGHFHAAGARIHHSYSIEEIQQLVTEQAGKLLP